MSGWWRGSQGVALLTTLHKVVCVAWGSEVVRRRSVVLEERRSERISVVLGSGKGRGRGMTEEKQVHVLEKRWWVGYLSLVDRNVVRRGPALSVGGIPEPEEA